MALRLIGKSLNIFRLQPGYDKRVFGLDIMRAYAIVAVVMGHARMLNYIDTDYPWVKILNGVELFFVLSGFLIGGILIRMYEKSERLGWPEISNFWVRRWFRTLPNYYLILLFNILLAYLAGRDDLLGLVSWKYFFFVHNFDSYFIGFFTESWSLSVEEWFYFLFPLVILVFHWSFKLLKIEQKYVILASILTLMVVPFLLRYHIASEYTVDRYGLELKIYQVVIFRLDSIALGILAAYFFRWHNGVWTKFRLLFFALGITLNYYLLLTDFTINSTWMKVFYPIVMSAGLAMLLPLLGNIRTGPKFLVKIITYISLASYSMYLLNMPVASLLTKNFPPGNAWEAWSLYFFYWFITIAASVLLYKYFEKPMMDLRDRFGRPSNVAVAAKQDSGN